MHPPVSHIKASLNRMSERENGSPFPSLPPLTALSPHSSIYSSAHRRQRREEGACLLDNFWVLCGQQAHEDGNEAAREALQQGRLDALRAVVQRVQSEHFDGVNVARDARHEHRHTPGRGGVNAKEEGLINEPMMRNSAFSQTGSTHNVIKKQKTRHVGKRTPGGKTALWSSGFGAHL